MCDLPNTFCQRKIYPSIFFGHSHQPDWAKFPRIKKNHQYGYCDGNHTIVGPSLGRFAHPPPSVGRRCRFPFPPPLLPQLKDANVSLLSSSFSGQNKTEEEGRKKFSPPPLLLPPACEMTRNNADDDPQTNRLIVRGREGETK